MSGIDTSKTPPEPQFFSISDLINTAPFDSAYVRIRDWVDQGSPASHDKITPIELANELEQKAAEATSLIRGLSSTSASLQCETLDIETWVNYGLYFANKLRGAVAMAQGEAGISKTYMQQAVTHWKEMIRLNDLHNKASIPDMQNAHGTFSWRDQLSTVQSEAD